MKQKTATQRTGAGFTLLEIMVVMALTGIVSSVAMIQMKATTAMLDADQASNLVISQLNYGRQLAVDQRRNVLVGFLHGNEIQVIRDEIGGGTTVLADVTLPSGYTFGLPSGIGDTPSGYGNGAAVYFNAGTSGTFLGDGTFVNSTNTLLNGSVFTIGGNNTSARAVTLSGSSGTVKQYIIQGNAWVVR
jgi:prepilin-type N-terminal cleavage/methylation domain-containing protein